MSAFEKTDAKFHREVKNNMPSNAILEQKQAAVAELTELIKASAGGVIELSGYHR